MNWGKKILIGYLSFVALMITMVYLCMQQKDIFLVSDNYYEDELAYESVIQKMKNVEALDGDLEIETFKNGLSFVFPEECKGGNGTLTVYRPSDANLDKTFDLNLSNTRTIVLNTVSFTPGQYVVKLDWSKGGKGYYLEHKIII